MLGRSILRPTCRIPEHRRRRFSTAERSKEIAVGRGGECNEHTRPAVPPQTSVRPRSGRIVSPRDDVRRRRCRARRRVAFHSGDNATAPRSARSWWRYRGSHGARCTRPRATHGYFLRPLRGRPGGEPLTQASATNPRVAHHHVRGLTQRNSRLGNAALEVATSATERFRRHSRAPKQR